MVLLLLLTSVRSAWLRPMNEVIQRAAARSEDGRAALMSVVRLDKRYPLELGFDRNLAELGEGFRALAPSIRASALVLEFSGFLAATMRAATATVRVFGRAKHPTQVHSTAVSGAAWLVPYVSAAERRDLRHYVDAVNRMKAELGCASR